MFKKSVFRFSLPELLPSSRRKFSGGLLGAGVPPFMGALTPFALWGTLKELKIKN